MSTSKVDGTQLGVTECDSFNNFTIAPFHHSKFIWYQAVWVRAMLIVLNEFGLITYLLTEKTWICRLDDSRTNNTLINYIYLCCVDTWKQLYMSTLGCFCYSFVHPRWLISGFVVLKQSNIGGQTILVRKIGILL